MARRQVKTLEQAKKIINRLVVELTRLQEEHDRLKEVVDDLNQEE